MAETLVSPGVLARENDQSQITAQPIQAGAAIVGPTVKGRVDRPHLVTSYSEYKANFGTTFTSGSNEYTYLTSISAYNYFAQGGTSLLVTRVASGTFAPSTASAANDESVTGGTKATSSFTLVASLIDGEEARIVHSGTTYRFIASDAPIPADDVDGNLYFFGTGSTATATAENIRDEINVNLSSLFSASNASAVLAVSGSSVGTSYNGSTVSTGSGATFSTQATLGGGVAGSGTGTSFTLETLAEGAEQNSTSAEGTNNILPSGSKDNLRWEVVSPNTASGTFSLLIRRGDDNKNQKIVLESYNNISLDPNQDNYITKVIGDMTETVLTEDGVSYLQTSGSYPNLSNYVRVKTVSNTVNYFDNNGDAKTTFTSVIPNAGSGSFGGASGENYATNMYQNVGTSAQGLTSGNYTTALSLLNNKDEYNYNLLVAPGVTRQGMSSVVSTIETQAQGRGDYLAVVDLRNYGSTVAGAISEASNIDSSYAATYWPWVQTSDPDTGDLVWVPASTMIPGVMAYNDRVAASWFAPAGVNRGGMGTVARAERKLTQGNRDDLYAANVNPIGTFPNSGVVVFGQKTMQKKASALDRVNVRRLLITLKDYISQIADTLVFEQNTIATRNSFLSQVNPYLQNVQQQQGLYAFKVVMDDTNNTPDVIDRNELKGQIFLQPTKTAEFIILDFNVTPTGASFPV